MSITLDHARDIAQRGLASGAVITQLYHVAVTGYSTADGYSLYLVLAELRRITTS